MAEVSTEIKGYDYANVDRSPVTLDELRELEATVEFTDEDRRALRQAGRILESHAEELVDGWRAIIGRHEHLSRWFSGPTASRTMRTRPRSNRASSAGSSILCTRPFDQTWLDYQHEIGLRHTPAKKNVVDERRTPPVVPLRYLLAFVVPVMSSVQTYLRNAAASPREAERMEIAWSKAVMLSVALWSEPYAKEGLW
jgi:hypothetical protein